MLVACCSKPKLAFKIITAKTGFYDFNLPINTMRQLSSLFASLCEANKSYRLKLINLRAHAYVDMATTRLAELYVG